MTSGGTAGPRGSGVLRHAARDTEWEPAAKENLEFAEAIERHIAQHFGPVTHVWHEFASDLVHVDVHVVPPSEERPWFTLVTSGMSSRPMTVPAKADSSPYAELMLCLPADWPMPDSGVADQHAAWPVGLLRSTARLPHAYGTWLGAWHSVPNGDPAQPYAPDTPFAGVVVTPMLRCTPEARTVTTPDGTRIDLLALVLLHPDEVQLKLVHGTNALIKALDRAGASELLDPTRPSGV